MSAQPARLEHARPASALGRLIGRCAETGPLALTAGITAVAIPSAMAVGSAVWALLEPWGPPSLMLTLAVTALIVAVPLAGLMALTVAWIQERACALGRQERVLRRREALLVTAQRLAKLGHWRWPVGAGYYELSEEVCPIFGLAADDPRLPMIRLFEVMHPDDQAPVREALRALVEEHRPHELEYRVFDPDGQLRTLWVDGRCETDEQGTTVAVFGAMQDITERKAGEAALRQACDAAQQASRAKSAFLANMSHELRTPLHAIIGFSEIIRDQRFGTVGDARYAEFAADIHDGGTHLLGLVEGLLDMAKIEAGRYALHEEAVDLRSAVERAVRLMRPVAAKRGQTIHLQIAEPVPVLQADERALRQMLINLLGNAIKFSRPGDPVLVRVEPEDAGIAIAVQDYGVGIPPDKMDELGTPFFQAHDGAARRFEGTGIGLSVTRSLAELHGGSLSLASRVGEGTCATVHLPVARLHQR